MKEEVPVLKDEEAEVKEATDEDKEKDEDEAEVCVQNHTKFYTSTQYNILHIWKRNKLDHQIMC